MINRQINYLLPRVVTVTLNWAMLPDTVTQVQIAGYQ
jgi:hypothetical protein